MVGIDPATEDRRHINGRKKKRDLLANLDGSEVSVSTNQAVLLKGVLHYVKNGNKSAVYVEDIQVSISAVQRVYPEQREIKLYGEKLI